MGEGETTPLFVEDEPKADTPGIRRHTMAIVATCVICMAVVAVPVALTLTAGRVPQAANGRTHLGDGTAMASVLSALSATTDSGSFNITYQFSGPGSPADSSTTAPTSQCSNEVVPAEGGSAVDSPGYETEEICGVVQNSNASGGLPITGQGTIDTNPYGMVATSQVPGLGTITLRTDGNDIWEMGGADYGLSPGASGAGSGSSLSGFASLVESTLGQREGASAMLGLASPTGYLNLDQQEITGADFIGTSTVDGVAVDQYRVFLDPPRRPISPT